MYWAHVNAIATNVGVPNRLLPAIQGAFRNEAHDAHANAAFQRCWSYFKTSRLVSWQTTQDFAAGAGPWAGGVPIPNLQEIRNAAWHAVFQREGDNLADASYRATQAGGDDYFSWASLCQKMFDTTFVWNAYAKLGETYTDYHPTVAGVKQQGRNLQALLTEKVAAAAVGGLLVHNQMSRPLLTHEILAIVNAIGPPSFDAARLQVHQQKRNATICHPKLKFDNEETNKVSLPPAKQRLSTSAPGVPWKLPPIPVDMNHLVCRLNAISNIANYDLGAKSLFSPSDSSEVAPRGGVNLDLGQAHDCTGPQVQRPFATVQLAARDVKVVRDAAQTVLNIAAACGGSIAEMRVVFLQHLLVEVSLLASNILPGLKGLAGLKEFRHADGTTRIKFKVRGPLTLLQWMQPDRTCL